MGANHLVRSVGDALVGLPLFLVAPLVRHWHLRWGATQGEIAAPMPGDDLVVHKSFTATRAISIDAPPELVWPWIVQVGFGRAGYYSYDFFDNAGRPSADRILLEYQYIRPGDWVPMAAKVNEKTAFKIAGFAPCEWMLWQKPDSTWAWKLVPLEGHRTRLVTRLIATYDWKMPASGFLSLVLLEWGDFPMMRKMLLGIRDRAERLATMSRTA